MFETAIAALAAGDGRTALDSLLQSWRERPAREVADAICTVGERTNDAVSTTLAQACAGTAGKAMECVVGLARLAPDPRVARAVVGWIADPPFHATASKPFWRGAFRLLELSRDPTSHAALAAAVSTGPQKINGATMRAWLESQASAIELPSTVPTILETDAVALAKAVSTFAPSAKTRATRPRPTSEDELLRAIRENPEDDAPRAVYGDWLLERGDPRGEFIQLQLARSTRTLSPEEKKRELELLTKHVKEWTGEPVTAAARFVIQLQVGLAPNRCTTPCFDRGFLAGFHVARPPHGQATAARLRRLIGHVAFATVVDFSVNPTYYRNLEIAEWPVVEFLSDPSLRAMRRLRIPTVIIPHVARGPHASRLTWLETLDYQNAAEMDAAIEACSELPALRVLSIVNVDGADSLSSTKATVERWRKTLGERVEIRFNNTDE